MNISKRVAGALLLALLIGLAGSLAVGGIVILGEFERAEAAEATTSMRAVAAQIENDRALLASSASAFGQITVSLGTTSTNATQDPETQAEQARLGVALFEAHGVDELYFVMPPLLAQFLLANATLQEQQASSGIEFNASTGVMGIKIDANGNYTSGDPALTAAMPGLHFGELSPLQQRGDLVAAGGNLWIVGAVGMSLADLGAPLPAGDGTGGLLDGPSGIALVVARRIDDAALLGLGAETGRELRLEHIGTTAGMTAGDVGLDRPTWSHMTARITLGDAAGDAVAVLASPQERTIFQNALQAGVFFLVATMIIGGIATLATVIMLERTVARPIRRLDGAMEGIRASGALDTRVAGQTGGRWSVDEVGHLAHQFDSLLENLENRTAELKQTNQDLDRFASVVSHDLLSPLSTVNASAFLLQAQLKSGEHEKAAEQVARIQRTSKTIEDRVRAVLAYARAGRNTMQPIPVALDEVVASTKADMAGELESSKAQLAVDRLPTVLGHRESLKQVFQNLISNAIKYHKLDQVPSIHVTATRAQSKWRITVSDDGVGFAESEVERMLTPFQRLERTKAVDGNGIGLATCQRILESLGGKLELHGQVGVGSQATVVLPAVPEGPSGANEATPARA